MALGATYYGANGWLLEFGELRVLVDPWLKGDLVFNLGSWLIKGELPHEWNVPNKIDILLLTQGIADHAHIESLSLLERNVPVFASPSAGKVVSRLGFKNINCLRHGEKYTFKGLTIQATKGAPVPMLENGYFLFHKESTVYLEPHGFVDSALSPQQIDIIISPVTDLVLPLIGPIIKGKQAIRKLIHLFNPKLILTSTTGGNIIFTGLLTELISEHGSVNELKKSLPINTRLIRPTTGKRYEFQRKNK